MELLLLSNSTNPGSGYLEHALDWFSDFLRGRKKVLFVPYAGVSLSWDEYTAKVENALQSLEIQVTGIHQLENPVAQLAQYEAIMVGGGNTFYLLKLLQERGLLSAMKSEIMAGTPFIGWSAGSNIAGPGIYTTNDMPVAQPASFESLGLLTFQINPHYTEEVLPNFHGETRLQRIQEFLALNPEKIVLGIPEGAALQVSDRSVQILNGPVARITSDQGRVWVGNWPDNAL